ncbi:hypothetical protein [Solidesulfovibrio sp. C21]|uniref:hypothetical protein n=1 Tax=Solidesulfovibrio sp. C21 TaxID=3398613 RepID=UPI0039FCE3CC
MNLIRQASPAVPSCQLNLAWHWQRSNFLQLTVIFACLADFIVILHVLPAATLTWDTAHYMLSYEESRFNELMTAAVPLFPRLFWWIKPDILAYRLLRYGISALLVVPLAIATWRFSLRRGGHCPQNGLEALAWTMVLVVASFLGNAMLVQFWPLGHHDLTSWVYMATAGLLLYSLGLDRPASWATCLLLGSLAGLQLLAKLPCVGGLLVIFGCYIVLFAKTHRWFCLGFYGLGVLVALGLLLLFICPPHDILAAVTPARIRFAGAYGAGHPGPLKVIFGQLWQLVAFIGEAVILYWPVLIASGLLLACAGRWREHLGERWGNLAASLLPVALSMPLLCTIGSTLLTLPMDPTLATPFALQAVAQRYGVSSNYGLPLAECVLFFLFAGIASRCINGSNSLRMTRQGLFAIFMLAAIPFFMAVGSSQSLMHYIQEGGWSFATLLFLGLLLVKKPVFSGRTFVLVVLCLFLFIQQYKYAAWLSYNSCMDDDLNNDNLVKLNIPLPHYSMLPLGEYTTPVKSLARGHGLLFTKQQAIFYSRLEELLYQGGFRPGDSILAFYGLGAPVYLLGGRSPGTPVYYPDKIFGQHFNANMLARALPKEIRSSFLLINEPLSTDIIDVFEQDGISIDHDYILLGQLQQPNCLDPECYKSRSGRPYTVSIYAPKRVVEPGN